MSQFGPAIEVRSFHRRSDADSASAFGPAIPLPGETETRQALNEPDTDFNEAVLQEFNRREIALGRDLTHSEQTATSEAFRQQFKGVTIPDAERVRQEFHQRRKAGISAIDNAVLAGLEVPAALVRGVIGEAAPNYAAELQRKANEPGNVLQAREGPSRFVGSLLGTSAIIIPAAVANPVVATKLLPAIFGVAEAGEVRTDIAIRRESGEDISRLQELSASTLSGATEAAFEYAGLKLVTAGGRVLRESIPQLKTALKTGSFDAIKGTWKNILKGVGISGGGALEEGATLITQNWIANIYKDQALLENVSLAALSGALLPVIGAPAFAFSKRLRPDDAGPIESEPTIPTVSENPTIQRTEELMTEGKFEEAAQRAVDVTSVTDPASLENLQATDQLERIRAAVDMDFPVPPPSTEPVQQLEQEPPTEQLPRSPLAPQPIGVDLQPPVRIEAPTTSVSDTVRAAGTELRGLTESIFTPITKISKATATLARRIVPRATRHFRSLGASGEQMATDYEAIGTRSQRNINQDSADIRNTVYAGLNRSQREMVGRIANGKLAAEQVPAELRKRAVNLLTIMDRAMVELATIGGKRRLPYETQLPIAGSGKPFPQLLNRTGKKALDEAAAGRITPKLDQWAQEQVAAGRVTNKAAAIRQLVELRRQQLRGINPYLEATRIELLDDWINWDGANTLPALLEKNWNFAEAARQWGLADNGLSLVKLEAQIADIEGEHGQKIADQVRAFSRAAFGRGTSASQEAQDLSNAIRGFQFTTKIAFSPLTILRNMLDRYAKGFTVGGLSANLQATVKFPPFINRFFEAGRKIKADAEADGAIFGAAGLTEGVEAGSAVTSFIGRPFRASEQGNQAYIALVAKLQLEKDLFEYAKLNKRSEMGKIFQAVASLGRNSQPNLQRRLERAGLDGAQLTRLESLTPTQLADEMVQVEFLTPELMSAALHRIVRDTTFPVTLATKRLWWDNKPGWRVLTQFKTWPVEQMAFINKHVIREAVKHKNFAPLAGFILATTIAGEIYNLVRDAITGEEEAALPRIIARLQGDQRYTAGNIAWHIAKDFVDGGGVGMLADLGYGVVNFAAGPAFATAKNTGDLFLDATKSVLKNRPTEILPAFNKFIRRESSAVRQAQSMFDKFDRTVLNKTNRVKSYTTWRERAYEFRAQQESGEIQDDMVKGITRFAFGFETFPRGLNTLSNQLIARQITVGDIGDAADFIVDRLEEAKDAVEQKKMITQIKQARSGYSPLGPLSKGIQAQFLKAFPEAEQREAIALQKQWLRDYTQAMKLAFERIKSERSAR